MEEAMKEAADLNRENIKESQIILNNDKIS